MIDPNLSFDSSNGAHRYADGDREMASVTEILRETRIYSDFKFLDRKYRQRGKAVHDAARLVDLDDYDEAGTHEEIRPYVRRFMQFVKDTGFKGIAWEVGMVNSALGVGGTLDTLATMRNVEGVGLFDLKSGQVPARVGVQTCAYEDLLKRGKLIENPNLDEKALQTISDIRSGKLKLYRRSLQLTPEKYTLRAHDDVESWSMWLTAVSIYNIWRKNNL